MFTILMKILSVNFKLIKLSNYRSFNYIFFVANNEKL